MFKNASLHILTHFPKLQKHLWELPRTNVWWTMRESLQFYLFLDPHFFSPAAVMLKPALTVTKKSVSRKQRDELLISFWLPASLSGKRAWVIPLPQAEALWSVDRRKCGEVDFRLTVKYIRSACRKTHTDPGWRQLQPDTQRWGQRWGNSLQQAKYHNL